MFYRILYQFDQPQLILTQDMDVFLRHKFFILDKFQPDQGHLMLEGYEPKEVRILVAFPSTQDPTPFIMQRISQFLQMLNAVECADFEPKRVHIHALRQAEFFDSLMMAAIHFKPESNLGVFYKTYYLEPLISTEDKVITLPLLQNQHMVQLLSEEKDLCDSIATRIKDLKGKPIIFIVHEANPQKAEAWFQWLSLIESQTRHFKPTLQFSTQLSDIMPLGDFLSFSKPGFQSHLSGQQWIIEVPAVVKHSSMFEKIIRSHFIPQVKSNLGLGQIILHTTAQTSLADWFEPGCALEFWSSKLDTEFNYEPEWPY